MIRTGPRARRRGPRARARGRSAAASRARSAAAGRSGPAGALSIATNKAHPGKVTLVVRNTGKIAHEFVLIKTAKRADGLAPPGETRASEKGAVGEIEEIKPGQTKRLTLTLKGNYALICNIQGHYMQGQSSNFYVR